MVPRPSQLPFSLPLCIALVGLVYIPLSFSFCVPLYLYTYDDLNEYEQVSSPFFFYEQDTPG